MWILLRLFILFSSLKALLDWAGYEIKKKDNIDTKD